MPLAVASDGVHWDIPNQTFEVYFPNNRTPYKWATKRTVAESGLDKFGSSRPEDPRSTPAASMTYQMLWAFRLPDGRPQLGVITNSRTGVKPMKELFGMIDGKGVDHFFQRFRIQAIRISLRPGEYFFGYKYFAVDNSDMSEAEGDSYKALHERFRKAGFSILDGRRSGCLVAADQSFEHSRDRSLDKDGNSLLAMYICKGCNQAEACEKWGYRPMHRHHPDYSSDVCRFSLRPLP